MTTASLSLRLPGASASGRLEDADADLVRRFLRDHDAAAFSALAKRHEAPVHRLVASILGPGYRADAEDLTQDIFVHVFHNLSSFRFRSRFSTWLYRVAYRKTIDQKRRARFSKPHLDEATLRNEPADGRDGLGQAIAREEAARLRSWVDQLSEPQRTAVVLFYWSESSIEEISQVLDAKPVTVRSWLHRARGQLARRLEDSK